MDEQHMKLESLDITQENVKKIKALFPNCVTEVNDTDGNVKLRVEWDILKEALTGEYVEGGERYEFTWPGKKAAFAESARPIRKTLRPCVAESKNWDTTQNLYIEGDNLEVLKLLQESYLGKVKMIYIDPPYNTGNDFVYRDKFSLSQAELDEQSHAFDADGNRYEVNNSTEPRYHSNWCSMIYPRLLLARNLLADDGVIFISIDDNEQSNLKKLCDEVFGESNFVATIVWQKKYAATNDAKGFSTTHDYIVTYAKNINSFTRNLLPRTAEQNAPYKNDDGDGKGLWRSDNLLVKSFSESGVYAIKNPNTEKEYFPPKGSCWRASKETMKKWLVENRIYFGKDGKGAPQLKRYLNEVQQGRVPITWWPFTEVGHNDAANKEVRELFGVKPPFDTPKPVSLIKQMMLIETGKDSIILDFFSGSATTAHAVMQLNAEDGGHRKFIMVQLPEKCKEGSEAEKAGYANICEIGKERIRRAGEKIKAEHAEATGLDVGFRVLKVADSNMKEIYYAPSGYSQDLLDGTEANIKSDRSDLDLLFGCVLDWGIPLDKSYTSEKIEGCTVHTYDKGSLVACFDENVPESVVITIAKRQPERVVFRDSSFGSSAAKINVFELFKLYAPGKSVKVI